MIRGALAYFAMIFALGFVLGIIRVTWGAGAMGEERFLLLELPTMLVASWFAARWNLSRFEISRSGEALKMGLGAFALLMLAEMALAEAVGGGAKAWLSGLPQTPGLYGLIGQIAFGLMPWVVTRTQKL